MRIVISGSRCPSPCHGGHQRRDGSQRSPLLFTRFLSFFPREPTLATRPVPAPYVWTAPPLAGAGRLPRRPGGDDSRSAPNSWSGAFAAPRLQGQGCPVITVGQVLLFLVTKALEDWAWGPVTAGGTVGFSSRGRGLIRAGRKQESNQISGGREEHTTES